MRQSKDHFFLLATRLTWCQKQLEEEEEEKEKSESRTSGVHVVIVVGLQSFF